MRFLYCYISQDMQHGSESGHNEVDELATPVVYTLWKALSGRQIQTSVQEYELPRDESHWDWDGNTMIVTVVLRHNHTEATSDRAKAFYNRLFEYCNTTFLSLSARKAKQPAECLVALSDLLVERTWGGRVLSSSAAIKNAIAIVFQVMHSSIVIAAGSPHWTLFQCVIRMLDYAPAAELANSCKVIEQLSGLTAGKVNIANIRTIIRLFQHNDTLRSQWALRFFTKLLTSQNPSIVKCVLDEIRTRSRTMQNFESTLFESILISHIGRCRSMNTECTASLLSLLSKIVTKKSGCISMVSTDKDVHEVLRSQAKMVHPVLFVDAKAFTIACPEEEIKW